MLFSEPKIPQSQTRSTSGCTVRAFQCSSASRKFLNSGWRRSCTVCYLSFSALQRAENSSIRQYERRRAVDPRRVSVLFSEPKIPQSYRAYFAYLKRNRCFSALQRAENSSIWWYSPSVIVATFVSVLFSEPKIPQSGVYVAQLVSATEFQCSSASRKFLNPAAPAPAIAAAAVSVLFSEPKIPQSAAGSGSISCASLFQCSSASRKFLNA